VHISTKELLTSFVGDALGPTVGLDDGCSEGREISVSKSQEIVQYSKHNTTQQSLTCFDGDPVGTSVGLEVGETDGLLLGLWEGDKLGLDVGCGMIRKTRTKYRREK